jgi:multiple sugar transport system permease protein
MQVTSPRFRKAITGLLLTALTYALLVVFLIPALWLPFTSVRPEIEIGASPPIWLPRTITLDNYLQLFGIMNGQDIGRIVFPYYLVNSIVIACASTAISIAVGTLAAYSFARFRFRGRQTLFLLTLFVRALPGLVLALPLFVLYRTLALQDTRGGLIIAYSALSIPFCTWLLEGFFAEVPLEIEDAARIDGCSRFQVLRWVAIPLAAPGMAATAVFVFMGTWDEFGLSLVLTSSTAARTMPAGLMEFVQEFRTVWGPLTAAGTFMLIPVVLFTLLAQRFLIRGLTFGALK